MGRFAPHGEAGNENPILLADITVGARCEVESSKEGFHKRGTVLYVGETKFSKGIWIGIEYDEPIGKNDRFPFLMLSYCPRRAVLYVPSELRRLCSTR